MESKTFLPLGKPGNLIFIWLLPVVLAILCFLKIELTIANVFIVFVLFSLYSFENLLYKRPISVTISVQDKMLIYYYCNCWGNKKTVTVNLSSAAISYKFTLLWLTYRVYGKLSLGFRLALYNDNYFHNRVVIKEDDKSGYSKMQLEQMSELINTFKHTQA